MSTLTETTVRTIDVTNITMDEMMDIFVAGYNAVHGTNLVRADFGAGEGDSQIIRAYEGNAPGVLQYTNAADTLWRVGQTDNE